MDTSTRGKREAYGKCILRVLDDRCSLMPVESSPHVVYWLAGRMSYDMGYDRWLVPGLIHYGVSCHHVL